MKKYLFIICCIILIFIYIYPYLLKKEVSETEIVEETRIENIYYDENQINYESVESEIQENNMKNEQEIKSVITDFLGKFHTYCYLDNSYMAKMISDYSTPSCLYLYLMSKVNGKSPWATDEDLMEYLEDYEPNRGEYITKPKVICSVSEISLMVDWNSQGSENYKTYVEYLLSEDDTTDSNTINYSKHMASLYLQHIDNQWKVSRIRYVSEGGIVGEYGIK